MLLQGLVRWLAARLGSGLFGTGASADCLLAVPRGLAWWARGTVPGSLLSGAPQSGSPLQLWWAPCPGDEPLPSSPPSPARRPVPDPGVRVAPLRVYVGEERLLQQEPSHLFIGEWGPPRMSSRLLRSLCGALLRAWSRSPGLPTSCHLQVLMGLGAIPLRARLLMRALNRNAALPRGLASCCRHSSSLYSEPLRRPGSSHSA